MENIYSKCVNKAGGYNPDVRTFEALSTKNQDLLEHIMDEIREWVYDHKSEKRKNFEVASLGTRKLLDKRIKSEYMGSGMFYNWSRSSNATFVEKTKRF